MNAVGACLASLAARQFHSVKQIDRLESHCYLRCRFVYSIAASRQEGPAATSISSTQLQLLNNLGTLPSIARYWDYRTAEAELRNVDAPSCAEFETIRSSNPTAVQRLLAQRYGVLLGATRQEADRTLAAAAPPSIRSLAVLYGVLGYDGEVPASSSAARQLTKELAMALPHAHPLDSDLSPVAMSQMSELALRLGFVGRQPFSYCAAQLLAACMRTILAEVDDEARLRPLTSMDARQADLIRYLRARRAPPGTRGLPAVLDVDLSTRTRVSRLAAARNILQLLQNHELSVFPQGEPVERLRSLGHAGPIPPTTGEARMLATELYDRCMPARPAQLAALRAAGYGSAGGAAPQPESVAHVKAVLRVLRRADTEAATPATRRALTHLADLRRRPLAALHAAVAAAAAAAAAAAPWPGAGGGGVGAGVQRPGPCPSQLEVRAAIEDLPLSEQMLESVLELGWSGPMPTTHGSALALKDYLLHQKAAAAAAANAAAAAGSSSHNGGTAFSPHGPSSQPLSHPHPHNNNNTNSNTSASSSSVSTTSLPPYRLTGQHQQPGTVYYYDDPSARAQQQQQQAALISRLAASPEEALTKIQIRGMFPGAVSEWYLPSMCRAEADHLLQCLLAARRVVLERAAGEGYDEYVERWETAEEEGDWWGMEWLWI